MKYIITINIPDGYEFYGINDEGNITLTPKQIKYPESYAECCKVLGIDREFHIMRITHKQDLIASFYRLLVCRDAYWKIAGEQMRLDRPWEPDWRNSEQNKYVISNDYGRDLNTYKIKCSHVTHILAFPTEEMREAFYDNFKNLIEQCKELL